MYQEFDFIETLKPYNTFGKKVVDCGEGRSYTVSYQQVERTKYEISITDCIPEDLKVEVDPRDRNYTFEKLAPNKFLVNGITLAGPTFDFYLKCTKFYKKVDPILPKQASKVTCINFDGNALKELKEGEIAECQYRPFEGVIIDCSIQLKCNAGGSTSINTYKNYEFVFTSKTHDLEWGKDYNDFYNNRLRFEFLPGVTSSAAVRNTPKSIVTLKKPPHAIYGSSDAAETMKIYEKKKSFQERIDSFGPTDVILKTVDGMVVRIHKEIFAAESPIFQALLEAETENPSEIDVIHDAETVFRAMAYVYDGKVDVKGFEMDCHKFAAEFGMPELKEKCIEAFEKLEIRNMMYTPKYSKFIIENNISSKINNLCGLPSYHKDKDAIKEFAKCSTPVL